MAAIDVVAAALKGSVWQGEERNVARNVIAALRPAMRDVVDKTWAFAMEDESVPSTESADALINEALASDTVELRNILGSALKAMRSNEPNL